MTLRRDAAIAESPPRHALIAASMCAAAIVLGHSAGTPAATAVAQDGLRQTSSQAYSLAGIWETDSQALPPDAFLEPRGLDVDPYDGPVYVVDGGNRRVQVFRSDGTHVRAIGGPGRGPEHLGDPRDVAVQGSQVFVTDSMRGRVAAFKLDGSHFGARLDLEGPWGIACSPDGRAYVVENEASRVSDFRSDGRLLAQWGGVGGGADRFNSPSGTAAATDGRLSVADSGNSRTFVYGADGAMRR